MKRSLCIDAALNEGYNCGFRFVFPRDVELGSRLVGWADIFSENLPGLCLHCQGGTVNSTETCCYKAKVEERCKGVKLPSIVEIPDDLIPTSTGTPAPGEAPGAGESSSKLSTGALAGIIVGGIFAVLLIAFLLLFHRRRRHQQVAALYLNRPSPRRGSPERNMQYTAVSVAGPQVSPPFDNSAGGRIARMSALESRNASATGTDSPPPVPLQELPRIIRHPSVDYRLGDSPDTRRSTKYTSDHRPLHPAPRDRNASLSSTSILVSERHGSDSEKEDGSQAVGSPVSEQLPYFKVNFTRCTCPVVVVIIP